MYQPSSSSSGSHGSMGPSGLARYGSAPESFLSAAADSVLGAGGGPTRDFSAVRSQQRHHNFYFSGGVDSASAESTCKPANPPYASESEDPKRVQHNRLERSYGSCMNQISGVGEAVIDIPNFKSGGADGGCNLVRHSSSPAGFFINQLKHSTSTSTTTVAVAAAENGTGFSVPRGLGSSNSKGGVTRLNSQLSFTRQDSILSHISEEESENGIDCIDHTTNGHRKAVNSYSSARYELCPWPNDSNAIVFSSPSSKRAKNINGGDVHSLNREESQLQFGLHQSALEMAAMDNLVHIPEDSVPCKIRAKRGCATHPRSIAERERRTRISGKLKKLQELVPNMDKQTSYADMLDLAVQHIKGLQNQVQKLNHELENCTCGCKQTT